MSNQPVDILGHNLGVRAKAHEALNAVLNHALTQAKQGSICVRVPVIAKGDNGPKLGKVRVQYESEYE